MLKLLASSRFSRYLKLSFLFWDLVLLNTAYILSFLIRFGNFDRMKTKDSQTVFVLCMLIWVFIVLYNNAYKIIRVERIESILLKTFRLILIHGAIITAFVVFLKYADISRMRLFYFYLLFFTLVFFFRVVFIKILKYARAKGYNYKRVLIIGANETGERMNKILASDLSYGYRVMGFFDEFPDHSVNLSAPLLGNFSGIEKYAIENDIDEMYIALHIKNIVIINQLTDICERSLIRIKFIPDFHQYTGYRKVNIDFYENVPVLMLRKEPLEIPFNRLMKSTFDKIFSLLVILLIFPWLFPLLMIAIKLGSKGPVFFKQQRSGEDNVSFNCLKFRTMRVNKLADELQATINDKRITKLGRFMRKTNLDELPQFFNVLIGQMSVVGPRPHMLKHTIQYSELINNYLVRHYVKPGITGWAQVNGYRGETRELVDMQKRVEYDIWYIENWNFFLDIKIIWRTITNIFKGEKNAF